MAEDLKAANPDTTFPSGGYLFGADSQSAVSPSVYAESVVWGYWKTLANAWSANSAASTPAASHTGTWFTGGTATTTKPHVLIEPTGTTSTGWGTSGTGLGINAASGFAGNHLDLQTAGVSKFKFGIVGGETRLTTGEGGFEIRVPFGGGSRSFGVVENGVSAFQASQYGSSIAAELSIGANALARTIVLTYDAQDVFAIRRSTNAHTFRTYGTYTDASNYRRVALAMTTAGVATLTAEGAGTGASGNVLHISSLPTSNPGPGILWNNAGTPAIGT
jgi:hypothetical protein